MLSRTFLVWFVGGKIQISCPSRNEDPRSYSLQPLRSTDYAIPAPRNIDSRISYGGYGSIKFQESFVTPYRLIKEKEKIESYI